MSENRNQYGITRNKSFQEQFFEDCFSCIGLLIIFWSYVYITCMRSFWVGEIFVVSALLDVEKYNQQPPIMDQRSEIISYGRANILLLT